MSPFSIIDGVAHSEVIGDVVVQVPPHVVGEVLLAPVRLPGAGDLEGVVVDQRHPARAVAPLAPPRLDMKMPPGPQCTVCGRE